MKEGQGKARAGGTTPSERGRINRGQSACPADQLKIIRVSGHRHGIPAHDWITGGTKEEPTKKKKSAERRPICIDCGTGEEER